MSVSSTLFQSSASAAFAPSTTTGRLTQTVSHAIGGDTVDALVKRFGLSAASDEAAPSVAKHAPGFLERAMLKFHSSPLVVKLGAPLAAAGGVAAAVVGALIIF